MTQRTAKDVIKDINTGVELQKLGLEGSGFDKKAIKIRGELMLINDSVLMKLSQEELRTLMENVSVFASKIDGKGGDKGNGDSTPYLFDDLNKLSSKISNTIKAKQQSAFHKDCDSVEGKFISEYNTMTCIVPDPSIDGRGRK